MSARSGTSSVKRWIGRHGAQPRAGQGQEPGGPVWAVRREAVRRALSRRAERLAKFPFSLGALPDAYVSSRMSRPSCLLFL